MSKLDSAAYDRESAVAALERMHRMEREREGDIVALRLDSRTIVASTRDRLPELTKRLKAQTALQL